MGPTFVPRTAIEMHLKPWERPYRTMDGDSVWLYPLADALGREPSRRVATGRGKLLTWQDWASESRIHTEARWNERVRAAKREYGVLQEANQRVEPEAEDEPAQPGVWSLRIPVWVSLENMELYG